jgi:hypothetical protein
MTLTAQVLASAPVTNWPARLALTFVVVALVLAVLALMRRAWVRRGARQADVGPLPAVPPIPQPSTGSFDGTEARYLGATRAGDWLERVVVHGLGAPSAAQVWIRPEHGVWIQRTGAPDLFLRADEVVGVRHDRGIAGRVLERDGVLVITWRHGVADLDVGLRVRAAEDAQALRAAIVTLIDHAGGELPHDSATTGDHA